MSFIHDQQPLYYDFYYYLDTLTTLCIAFFPSVHWMIPNVPDPFAEQGYRSRSCRL